MPATGLWHPESFQELQLKTLLIALFGASVLVLAGCNTVSGAGKDVQATGAAVEKAAEKAKPN